MSALTYPRHVYGRGGVFRIIHDAESYHEALSDGWTDAPREPCEAFVVWDGSPLVCDDGDAEIGVTQTADPPKRKGWPKGKPRKPMESAS